MVIQTNYGVVFTLLSAIRIWYRSDYVILEAKRHVIHPAHKKEPISREWLLPSNFK